MLTAYFTAVAQPVISCFWILDDFIGRFEADRSEGIINMHQDGRLEFASAAILHRRLMALEKDRKIRSQFEH